ncbi:MAG: hypothetical protein EBW86_08230 [Rhodobacteraceae bacterium]|nr:hypothetical protein [Paracoccaceae bacterium]
MAKFYQDLILKYFKAVDDQDLDSILATLHPNCSFSVETHGVKLIGQKEISQMFHRLWRNHKSVKHENFYFVNDALNGSVAVRFNVINELKDGTLVTVRQSSINHGFRHFISKRPRINYWDI